MARTNVSPLDWKTPIVDPKTGTPSLQFVQLWQQLFGNEDGTNATATTAATTAAAAVPQTRKINTTAPIAGGGDLSADLTLTHATSGVAAATYGDSTHVPQFTVDNNGHVTAVTNVLVSGGGGAVSLISEVVTSASQASVTFSSISASYRDLIIVVRGRSNAAAIANDSVIIQFNSDTTSGNYIYENMQGSNSTVSSGAQTSAAFIYTGEIPAAAATATFAGVSETRVLDYRGTTFFKDTISRSGAQANTNLVTQQLWGAWKSTSAINAVKVFLNLGNFVNGSVVSLYGSN